MYYEVTHLIPNGLDSSTDKRKIILVGSSLHEIFRQFPGPITLFPVGFLYTFLNCRVTRRGSYPLLSLFVCLFLFYSYLYDSMLNSIFFIKALNGKYMAYST